VENLVMPTDVTIAPFAAYTAVSRRNYCISAVPTVSSLWSFVESSLFAMRANIKLWHFFPSSNKLLYQRSLIIIVNIDSNPEHTAAIILHILNTSFLND